MWLNEILLRKYTNAYRKNIVLKTKEDKVVIRNTFRTRQGQQEYTTWKNWWNIVPMFHCIFPKKIPQNVVLEFRISDVMTFLWISLQLNDLRNITTTLKNLNPIYYLEVSILSPSFFCSWQKISPHYFLRYNHDSKYTPYFSVYASTTQNIYPFIPFK